MKKGILIKKGVLITISAIAVAGLGYFIYQKIADRNKEIIKDGTFTIKVDETASTGVPAVEDFDEDVSLDSNYDNEAEAPNWNAYATDSPTDSIYSDYNMDDLND